MHTILHINLVAAAIHGTLESYLFGMQKCRASSENLHKK